VALSDAVGAERTNVVNARREDIKKNVECMTKES
jgi:hypothetical protein